MTPVLITGALGNVGREVTAACIAAGLPVRVAGTREAPLRDAFPGAEHTRFDFLDRATWEASLAGCRALFLLRPPPLGDMKATLDPFVDAAYAAGVEHIVFLSVAGADRMKWVPHHEVEAHLARAGMSWTVLRPGFFAQNFADAYRRDIVEDSRIYVPAAHGRVAFVDARDIGAVAARVFTEPHSFRGEALTLTGPEAITFDNVATMLTHTLRRTVHYEPASVFGYAHHLRTRRALPWMQIAVQTVLHVGLRRGDAERVDPTIERVLGRPAGTVQSYIARAASVWQA